MKRLALTCSLAMILLLGGACTAPTGSGESDGLHVTVPGVVGLEETDARSVLEEAGYVVGEVAVESAPDAEPGTVIEQSPIAAVSAPRGSSVDLVIAGP